MTGDKAPSKALASVARAPWVQQPTTYLYETQAEVDAYHRGQRDALEAAYGLVEALQIRERAYLLELRASPDALGIRKAMAASANVALHRAMDAISHLRGGNINQRIKTVIAPRSGPTPARRIIASPIGNGSIPEKITIRKPENAFAALNIVKSMVNKFGAEVDDNGLTRCAGNRVLWIDGDVDTNRAVIALLERENFSGLNVAFTD